MTEAKETVATALIEGEINAEIAKLAALPIVVYETRRIEAAEKLGIRVIVLDMLVAAERDKTAKAEPDFLPHWKVDPSSDPVDGAVLLNELRQYFNRYAVTPKHAAYYWHYGRCILGSSIVSISRLIWSLLRRPGAAVKAWC